MMPDQAILVTGAAGFIGFHVAQRLLQSGHRVVGVDNLNAYYDPRLKAARLDILRNDPRFQFERLDVADRVAMPALFARYRFPVVIHLAAQAGVRYSLKDPHAYVDANLVGFTNILEGCRHNGCRHLLFASSSSVYGANRKLPFSVHDNVDHPISLYAASKKAGALGGAPDPGSSTAPWRIYNVGNNKPQELLLVLDILEQALGRKAKKEMLPMQPGDVPTTYADVDDLVRDVGFRPATPIEDGIRRFASWYRSYCEA